MVFLKKIAVFCRKCRINWLLYNKFYISKNKYCAKNATELNGLVQIRHHCTDPDNRKFMITCFMITKLFIHSGGELSWCSPAELQNYAKRKEWIIVPKHRKYRKQTWIASPLEYGDNQFDRHNTQLKPLPLLKESPLCVWQRPNGTNLCRDHQHLTVVNSTTAGKELLHIQRPTVSRLLKIHTVWT